MPAMVDKEGLRHAAYDRTQAAYKLLAKASEELNAAHTAMVNAKPGASLRFQHADTA